MVLRDNKVCLSNLAVMRIRRKAVVLGTLAESENRSRLGSLVEDPCDCCEALESHTPACCTAEMKTHLQRASRGPHEAS